MLPTVYTGLPVFLAVAIKGLVSHLVDEYVLQQTHKTKMLVAFMKQVIRSIKNMSVFIVRRRKLIICENFYIIVS